MSFESAAPSIVRSVKQRDLLNTWLRLRSRCGALPPVTQYTPARLEDELKDIVYYRVNRGEFCWRFVIDSNGSRLSQAYGTADRNNIGTDLRDYLGPRLAPVIMPNYEECARRALPAYSIAMVNDINGRAVAYERLLLPFSSGGDVTHIIASLKTISEDGKFEINNLLRDPSKAPEYRLRAVIDRDLTAGQLTREGRSLSSDGDDVVEI